MNPSRQAIAGRVITLLVGTLTVRAGIAAAGRKGR